MKKEDLIQKLEDLSQTALTDFEKILSIENLLDYKSTYLNKKNGEISKLLKALPQLDPEGKKVVGQQANELKKKITGLVKAKEKSLNNQKNTQAIDMTQPGEFISPGFSHILQQTIDECIEILGIVGFSVKEGPEIETEYYNFDALNIPADHPARDEHDTFFVSSNHLLRTHTSPVQIREMKKKQPPISIISPGVCYRSDTPDATHSPVFYQIEGLCVDQGISFADLKGVLNYFFQSLLSPDIKLRFRPSFFPFTEPSTEVDISCIFCSGKGCPVCKHTGWIEVMGAGMVDPEVFKAVGYDPEKYSGYAFGMGIERATMLKYRINDIRLFFENDFNFLKQF